MWHTRCTPMAHLFPHTTVYCLWKTDVQLVCYTCATFTCVAVLCYILQQTKMASGTSNVDINIRKATVDDYEGVLNINTDVYDGTDYLPIMYHHFIRDPKADCYVAEVDGKIVSTFLMNE